MCVPYIFIFTIRFLRFLSFESLGVEQLACFELNMVRGGGGITAAAMSHIKPQPMIIILN